MRERRILPIGLAAWISILLAGCSPMHGKEDLLPQEGPTMMDVYKGHFGRQGGIPASPRGASDGPGLEGYTRDAHGEVGAQFRRLPNPDLVMYVFPHLSSGSGYPVPGYSTVLPMYEHVEYALPGEAEGWD